MPNNNWSPQGKPAQDVLTNYWSSNPTATNPTATNLTAVAPPTASINHNFIINSTLSAGTSGIADANITLQRSTDNATWNNVTTNVTDANGNYQFSNNESAASTYCYRTAYDGNATYANATSNVVTVQVTTILTQLSAAANLTSAVVNQNFIINGTLTDANGNPIAGATITLQNNSTGSWTNVTTTTTDANGAYNFSTSEPVVGTYQYQTTYSGSATYGIAASKVVSVTVQSAPGPLIVTAVNPANNSNGFPSSTTVSVTFNQTIQAGANYSAITLSDGNPAPITTAINDTTLTITPNATLAYNTTYALAIPQDAVENGTTTLATDFASTFATVAAPSQVPTQRLLRLRPQRLLRLRPQRLLRLRPQRLLRLRPQRLLRLRPQRLLRLRPQRLLRLRPQRLLRLRPQRLLRLRPQRLLRLRPQRLLRLRPQRLLRLRPQRLLRLRPQRLLRLRPR